jgi:predicted nucleic acid-binding protein
VEGTGLTDTSSLVFVDTWGWWAISNSREAWHQRVKQTMEFLLESGNQLITTNFVLDETYTLVRFRVNHQASVELHQRIEQFIAGQLLKVIHILPELEQAAWRIFERYSDKDFSFTDCTSFAVMQLLKTRQVLTDDHHFEQMGFVRKP